MREDIQKAADVLKNGGILIFPTDTAYGIGCRIDNEKAVERLFEIKGRDFAKAVPVLVGSLEMAKSYAHFQPEVYNLTKKYWPGGLTLILPSISKHISPLIQKNGTIGLRMPDKKVILKIISLVGVPIIGTSANFAGEKTPYSFEELDQNIVNKVDFVLQGICEKGLSSTVLDVSTEPWRILRQGPVTIKGNSNE